MNSSLFYVSDLQRQALVGQLEDLYNKNKGIDFTFSNYAKLDIIPGLSLNSQIGLQYAHTKVDYFQPSTVRNDGKGYAYYNYDARKNVSIETYLAYTKTFNKIHNINALFGNSLDYNQYEGLGADATGGSGDAIKTIQGYTKESIFGWSSIESNSMVSFWGHKKSNKL